MTEQEYYDRLKDLLAPELHILQQYGLEGFLRDERIRVCRTSYAAYHGPEVSVYFGAAAYSFLIFRGLHDRVAEDHEIFTLLGDYFFSAFSDFLIPIDSTEVVLAFSAYLKNDVQERCEEKGPFDPEAYCGFLIKLAEELYPDGNY